MEEGVACFALCASSAWRKYSLLGSTMFEVLAAGDDDVVDGVEVTEWVCRREFGVDILERCLYELGFEVYQSSL